jgi:2-polyprenyl-3-methyl-5-hydroxy-6-metoxy-1,4-benzoquinol methylase
MNFIDIIDYLLKNADPDAVGLRAAPLVPNPIASVVTEVIADAEKVIGVAAVKGDYYQCCQDRFSMLVSMAVQHLPPGARILDIGNAPGYLAIMLDKAGYSIDGINLSDDWNSTYPDISYVDHFRVQACDIEKSALPYPDCAFDAIVFTEVLEHIALRHPRELLPEFLRVLRPGGLVLFSTPNVCNVSNIVSLMKGNNIFWDSDIFFGGTDRHNREFTPKEARELFEGSGFVVQEFFGINDHANWRSGSAHHIYDFQAAHGDVDHALMRNTIIGLFAKPSN